MSLRARVSARARAREGERARDERHLLLERSEEEGVRRAAMARAASAAQPGLASLPDIDEVGRVAFLHCRLAGLGARGRAQEKMVRQAQG